MVSNSFGSANVDGYSGRSAAAAARTRGDCSGDCAQEANTVVSSGVECQTTLTKRPGRPVGMPHERRLQQICRTRYHLLNRVNSSGYSHGKPTDVDYFHFDSALRIRRRLSEAAAINIDTSRPTDSPLCDYPVLHGT